MWIQPQWAWQIRMNDGLKTCQFLLDYTPYVRVDLFPTWHLDQAKGSILCDSKGYHALEQAHRNPMVLRPSTVVMVHGPSSSSNCFASSSILLCLAKVINAKLLTRSILTRKVVERPSRQSLRAVNCQRNRRLH